MRVPAFTPGNAERERGSRRSHVLSELLAVPLACLVLLPLLGHRSLADWDEGIYAEISREMLAGGWRGWLVPHWNGHLWFEKPPLLFWVTAPSLRIFGATAFGARLPSAVAGIVLVGILHGWMQRRLSVASAWLATCLLLSAFGFQHAARAGETDTLLSLGCVVSVMGLAEVTLARPRGWWLFWGGFGMALMTKGAASVVLPISAVTLLAVDRKAVCRFRLEFLLGLALFLLLVLPWHLWMTMQFGRPFLRAYLGFHVLGRATGAIEGHRTHGWFYFWVLLVSAPPFALLYPPATVAPFRGRALRPLRAFAVFALVVLVLFTAASTRLPHYIAPAYPAFSVLAGALLTMWLGPWARTGRRLASLGLGMVALYVAAAAATAKPRKALHSPRLPSGFVEPDNRESAALLQRARPQYAGVPGPLLVWRGGDVVPLTTDAFYARRLVRQATLGEGPAAGDRDIYYADPTPLRNLVGAGPRVLLLDRSLLPALPSEDSFGALAVGPTQMVGIVRRSGS